MSVVLKPRALARGVGSFRFLTIESDCRLNIFGEIFLTPPETWHEYVVATIDVKEQKLKVFLDTVQVEEYRYQMR